MTFQPGTPSKLGLKLAVVLLAGLAATPAATAQRTRYLAFGDSITSGLGTDENCNCVDLSCQQLCGYPRRLRNRLRNAGFDVGVLNFGQGSERTPEGLTRLDQVLEEGEGHVLLLMEGTNDINRRISPETTLANLAAMGDKALFQGLETVHATLIPRWPPARVDPENETNAFVAMGIRELAFSAGRLLVDPFEVLGTFPDLFETYYSEIPNDPVGHPNSAGYDVLADVFLKVLTNFDDVPPVVGSVTPADGAEEVPALSQVKVLLYDFGAGIDSFASSLMVNGTPVPISVQGGFNWQELTYRPETALPFETAVRVRSSDVNLNTMDREVTRFTVDQSLPPGPCEPDETNLCIDNVVGDRRFHVTAAYATALDGGQSGDAKAIPLAPIGLRRGGLFTFFGLQNPEILVKVLDGCAINNHFWVFVAPTTSLGYELRVVDTVASQQGASPSDYEVLITNPDGKDAEPVADTSALATCDIAP